MELLVDDGGSVDKLEAKIMTAANRARASFLDISSSVAKLGIIAEKLFGSTDEIIAFTELLNKNFIVAGASSKEAAMAMYQLTQAIESGRLQGDEFRSIIEKCSTVGKHIEDYMINVVKAKGTLKDWARKGRLTADVIKAAVFRSADEINERFNDIPMTFGQVMNIMGNMLLEVFNPVLQAIGRGAQWIYDNWSKN